MDCRGPFVLGASFLPGLCQTAFRAELFAVAFSLHCAERARAPFSGCGWLWSDCLGVLNKLTKMLQGHVKLAINRPNSDLWSWIQQSVNWKFFHNGLADRAARWANHAMPAAFWDHWEMQRLANHAMPAAFWDHWEMHVKATHAAEELSGQVQRLHLAVGRQHGWPRNDRGTVSLDEVAARVVRETQFFHKAFDLGSWRGEPLPTVTRRFGRGHVD